MLFGSYRRGDANDPDAYVLAISAVLSSYDMELIQEVTDPRTGISATEKFASFMPNAGELKVYCDGVAAVKARIQRLGALPAPSFNRAPLEAPRPAPGDLATVFVPKENPRHPNLVEWSKTADSRLWKIDERPGIWVSFDTWENRAALSPVEPPRAPSPSRFTLSEDARAALAEQPAGAYQEAGET